MNKELLLRYISEVGNNDYPTAIDLLADQIVDGTLESGVLNYAIAQSERVGLIIAGAEQANADRLVSLSAEKKIFDDYILDNE